ncbi:MAG: nucleotidyl transferase AbiEii/AbiGii toxin family protein [Thermodesulfovibrionia bacterium]|nr:nucleotidyl transferase AbiEii/AbiGii toxin family protein [Thermodesulfovibrionia bacterium]
MPAEYYNNILYPLQDKVFPLFNGTPFYLTGGTALSRGYYNHRFSDDLDYFVNYHTDFRRISEIQIEKLVKAFEKTEVDYKGEYFYRIFVNQGKLKIEMVNDVPSHIGKLVNHPVLGIIDSKENILANKLTAVADRTLPKDMVDIYFLLKDGLSIKNALTDAESKAAGISPLLIAKILAEFDYQIIDNEIKWTVPVPSETIRSYLNNISLSIVEGRL